MWEVYSEEWSKPWSIVPIYHELLRGKGTRNVAEEGEGPEHTQSVVGVKEQYKEFSMLQRGFGID